METQTLQAEVRTKSGKGPARQLRMRGMIPAIFYGPGTEPVKLSVSPSDLEKVLSGPYGRNQVIELDQGGTKSLAVVRDLEIHPVGRHLLHVDLYAVAPDRKIDAIIPFEATGRSLGVQKGGAMRKPYREVPVRGFPLSIPASVVVDVSNFDIGHAVEVRALPLPEGVESTWPPEKRVLFIDAKERKKHDPDDDQPATPAAAATPATPAT